MPACSRTRFGSPTVDRETQLVVRERVGETRRAMLAVIPDAVSPPIAAIFDPRLARGLHQVASAHDAAYLVVGSSHHAHAGRMLFGGSAERVIDGAPCPVAVAPPGFRHADKLEPLVVGAAYDDTPPARRALRCAVDIARAAGAPVRVVSVMENGGSALETMDGAAKLVAEWGEGDVAMQPSFHDGDPGARLLAETDGNVGLMVAGSRGRGVLQRVLLGSVSTKLVREAHCPVVVVPPAR